jgi:hypothetical protein
VCLALKDLKGYRDHRVYKARLVLRDLKVTLDLWGLKDRKVRVV